jgi:hypothetical protein
MCGSKKHILNPREKARTLQERMCILRDKPVQVE